MSETPAFTITTVFDGWVAVGELDAATAAEFALVLAEGGPTRRNIYMEDVSFMDSSGLRVLVEASRLARDGNMPLTLVRPSASVRRLLQVSGLIGHLPVVD